MGKESLLRRMLATQAWVDQRKLQTGFLGREDHDKLEKALGLLVESQLFIDDTAGISLAEMRPRRGGSSKTPAASTSSWWTTCN